jgi:hypothetical protein
MSETCCITHTTGNRTPGDRRQHTWRTFPHTLIKSRRKGMRRDVDKKSAHYVDFHEPIVFAMTIAIICLSCIDSFFTLLLLNDGAQEINPLMLYLIEINITLFVCGKILLTTLSLMIIIAHKNFWLVKNIIQTRHILTAALIMYLVLFNYEISLLTS